MFIKPNSLYFLKFFINVYSWSENILKKISHHVSSPYLPMYTEQMRKSRFCNIQSLFRRFFTLNISFFIVYQEAWYKRESLRYASHRDILVWPKNAVYRSILLYLSTSEYYVK